MKRKLYNSLLVAAGGGIGSSLRYIVTLIPGIGFFSTLCVNIIGSLILGFITSYLFNKKEQQSIKLLLGTGFCGGFTTMSTLSLEITELPIELALGYICLSLALGIGFAFIGMKLAIFVGKEENS
ncbi:fluoride efflux transporter FluC [Metabacillus niabensis]|uniref:fluoride efflux transporter FluC n=1 Tax=Metabacillus niabensis TaxID=324854 RepID=UPI00399F4A85